MKKVLITATCILLLSGCKLLKNVDKKEVDSSLSEQITHKTTRQGDTVRYVVPKFVFKDTTIYSVNRQGTTLKTVFDNEGRVSEIECLSSRIDELMTINRDLIQQISSKEKTEKAEPDKWFWIWVGVAAYVVFILSRKFNLL